MVDIGAELRTLTLSDATVAQLVGTRMYSDAMPQNAAMPAIEYMVIDTVPNEHLGGIIAATQARVQIDSYAVTRSEANELADAVRLALEHQHRGETAATATFINEISLASGEIYGLIEAEVGTDQRRYVTTLDFLVYYRTATS